MYGQPELTRPNVATAEAGPQLIEAKIYRRRDASISVKRGKKVVRA